MRSITKEKIVPDEESQSSALFKTEAVIEEEASFVIDLLWKFLGRRKTAPEDHVPIPQTSVKRQRESAHDHAFNINALLEENEDEDEEKPQTVLYLAYGSNMSSTTFRKSRGITPVSQINVCVPALSLTFDLPGIPYLEPCFAATRYRDSSAGRPESLVTNGVDERTPFLSPGLTRSNSNSNGAGDGDNEDPTVWQKPLVGVVYEVTRPDYARIIATEGGGASYIDIAVDCYPFSAGYDPAEAVPNEPKTTPFRAHTLLSPSQVPNNPDSIPTTNNDRKPPRIRHPTYAQPSPRYKNLLVTGAREHNLPIAYRDYLSSVQPYVLTTFRQRVGQILFCSLWIPMLLSLMAISATLVNERGRAPKWLVCLHNGVYGGMWGSYDMVFRRLFGDGERTIGT